MKAVTTITITHDDIVKLAVDKGLLPVEETPTLAVTSTTGWMGTNQLEVVQLQYSVTADEEIEMLPVNLTKGKK